MISAPTIADEIVDLKKKRKAILLAHHYQEPEIQELADVIGDSLELARKAREFSGDAIAFCGVWFMAETAKCLNPDRIVVVPDRDASCSLVEACPVEPVREFRRRNPDHVIVSYINTSIEVKAESDILCTSRNAVQIVNSIPREKPVLFLPDANLGNYVRKQTGRENMQIWQGTCIVHATSRRAAWLPPWPNIPRPKWWRIRNAPRRCWPWPISSAPRRPSFSTAPPAAPASLS
jgi:quinolinate synthase